MENEPFRQDSGQHPRHLSIGCRQILLFTFFSTYDCGPLSKPLHVLHDLWIHTSGFKVPKGVSTGAALLRAWVYVRTRSFHIEWSRLCVTNHLQCQRRRRICWDAYRTMNQQTAVLALSGAVVVRWIARLGRSSRTHGPPMFQPPHPSLFSCPLINVNKNYRFR